MNPSVVESLLSHEREPSVQIVEQEEEKEAKSVSARLVLTKEQQENSVHNNHLALLFIELTGGGCLGVDTAISVAHSHVVYHYFKMDVGTLSGTAEFSDEDTVEEFQHPPTIKEVQAKFSFTEAQQSDLLEAFNLLDYTGEGKIDAEDFRVAIKALGYEPTKEELQKMVNAVDKGSTGRLSYENFETAIMRKIMSKDNDGDIMKSFRLFDIDDRGFISFDNLKKVTRILEIGLTDEEIDEMIDDADKNFDSLVSPEEFMKMIKNSVHIVTP